MRLRLLLLLLAGCASSGRSSAPLGEERLPADGYVETIAVDGAVRWAFVSAPGERAVVLRSAAGGPWERRGHVDPAGHTVGAAFHGEVGWALHAAIGTASLLRTGDSGATWVEQAQLRGRWLRLVEEDDGSLLVLGSTEDRRGAVLRSLDGRRFEPWAEFDGGEPEVVAARATFGGRTFLAGGGSGSGALFASQDGRVFRRVDVGRVPNLLAIAFDAEGTGLAVGSRGEALRTIDGGATWRPTLSGTDRDLAAVQFVAPGSAYLCGASGTVLVTTDGGETFRAVDIGRREDFFRLVPSPEGGACVVGARGAIPRLPVPASPTQRLARESHGFP
jgi:photosystem II stability/assembly factor-like uncharacterized protein